MNFINLIFVIIFSYFIGGISFSRIAARKFSPAEDLVDSKVKIASTNEELTLSGISATTIGNKLGEKAGCLVGLLDMAKAFLPVIGLRLLFPQQPYSLVAAIMVMVGHNWPVIYGFKGGHGYSTLYGGLIAIDPIGAITTSVVGMGIGLLVFKDFMIAYLAGMWLLIPWMWLRWHDSWYVIYAVFVNVLFMLAMIPEIKQVSAQLKAHEKPNLRATMQDWPMGRGMLKMAEKMKIRID